MAYNQSSSDEFGSILSSISSSHIEQAASPRPPSGGHRSPSGHERHLSSASSSYASHHSPSHSNYDLSYAQGSSSSNGAGPSGGWGGDGSFASSGFGRDSSGSGVGPTDHQSYRQHHHHQPTASASSSVSYGGGAFDEASFLAQFSQGGQPSSSEQTGGGRPAGEDSFSPRASSSASRPPSFVLNDHEQTSNISQQDQSGQGSSGGDQGGPASFESWQHLIQPQPQHPLPPSNPFDFNAQPLPAFNFTTTHPPSGSNSPAVPDWANGNFTGNPSLLHRSSHSPSHSFDGHDDGSFRSRSSSYAGSSHGPPSDAGDPDQPPSFNFTPAAVDEAMRGLTFEDLALIAAAGGSPLPTSHHSSPSFSQHNNDPRSSSPYNPASPAQAQSHHSPFAHSIRSNPSPPQFNVAYSPASNPTSPSPPTAGLESCGPGKTMSPPTLVIPPDPTEASMMMTSPTETKPTSASSLFPPVDPRMVGVMRLATEGAGGPGGPQINIVPSTPTSGQLTGQPFSQHLAELNRRHQELLQKQQQQQQNSAQPPLHSLDTSSPRPSFSGFPLNGQQQHQQSLHNAPALTQQQQQAAYAASQAQQAQFVAMMSLVGMQQQMAQQQLAQQYQQQQQQQTGGQAANGGSNAVPDPMAAWMASLAQMGQHQQQQGHAGSQQYGHHQRAESFSHHHQPHQSSSYQPFDFINPDHQQQQQQQPPNQHHDIFPPLPYLSQPSAQQPNPVSRQLKAPPIRQRSRSEASLIPYDFGPSPPQAPTMDPSLLPGSSSNPNASFFPPLSSPNISFSADPTSLSDDGTVSHQGSLPSPSTFSFPFFVAPVRKATDDSMRGLGDLDGPGLGTMGTGGGSSEASHPRRSSFGGGQRAFGPGTPEYGRRLLNPWGRGGGGEDGDDGSDVGVRRSSSDAGSKRKGHRKAKSAEVTASSPDFLRSITRSDGTLGVPAPHSPRFSQHLSPESSSSNLWTSSPDLSASSRSRSRSPTPDILALDPADGGGSDGGGSVSSGMSVISKHSVTTKKTAVASQGRRKVAAQFVCPIPGCGSTFTRSFNLKGHLRSHTDERPFKCETCGKAFARQHDCKRHMALHVGYRPHTCLGCERKFARLDALARHLKSEAGQECIRSGRQPPIDEPDDGGSQAGSSTSTGGSAGGKKKSKGAGSRGGVLL